MDTAIATRWVFVYMLSQADAHGRYRCATVPALARAANVSEAEAEQAVRELEAPDPKSTSEEEEGRRILPLAGGWQLVNYAYYRDFRTEAQVREAERKANWRAGGKRDKSRDVRGSHGDGGADVRRKTPDDRTDNGLRGEPRLLPSKAAADIYLRFHPKATVPGA